MMAGLVEALAAALELMVDATCPTMRALWLSATERERRRLREKQAEPPACSLPAPYAQWKKSKRSKYEALATFRHAVVWRLPPTAWAPESPAGRVYFTPCTDEPPFRAGGADGRSDEGLADLEEVRSQLVELIRLVRSSGAGDQQWTLVEEGVAEALTRRATRSTLRDVLKLDEPRFAHLFGGDDEDRK
jgi:hypothetical protein